MKSRPFKYVSPSSLVEACAILAEHGDDAKVLAGGQSLVPAMNMRFASPEILVDISRIADMKGISLEGAMLRIGAMSRHVDVLNSDLASRHAPLIHSAMPHIAHAAIRNRGTFGGSLANADPASELPACVMALDARLNIQGSIGNRVVAVGDFFEGTYATCLDADEILVSVDVPISTPETRVFFEEISRRRGDYAMAGLAAHAILSGGIISDVRLVFFGVSDIPVLAASLSNLFNGKNISAIDADVICDALGVDIQPMEDLTTSTEAKLHLMKVLTRRAIAVWGEG